MRVDVGLVGTMSVCRVGLLTTISYRVPSVDSLLPGVFEQGEGFFLVNHPALPFV